MRLPVTSLLAFVLTLAAPCWAAASAQRADSVATVDSVESFARAHLALDALRDKVQAELAAPGNKKAEVQADLREKLRTERARILKEHGLTEERFARMTHRVAVDESARQAFEQALARLAVKKGSAPSVPGPPSNS